MELRETGIILFVEHYEKALAFYTQKLGLPLRKKGESLSILEFGSSYLMIEKGGVASSGEKTRAQNPTVLRLNVHDFEHTIEELRERGVNVEVLQFEWGKIGVIIDPEGNRIEIKD